MKNIIIPGASGNIARYVIDILLKKNKGLRKRDNTPRRPDSNPKEAARDEKLTDEQKLNAISFRSSEIGDQVYVGNW